MGSLTDKTDEWLRRWSRSAESLLAQAMMMFGFFMRLIGRPMAMRFAVLIGDFLHHVVGLRRQLVYRNLGLTFPEKSPDEISSIATGVYRNLAVTLVDVFRFPLVRSREDAAALVDIDAAPFWRATGNGQKGAVMVSGHYGNWELMALAFGMTIKPMTIIVKELSNTPLDRVMNRFRTLRGNRVVYDDQALRTGLRLLEQGGVLAILADQSDPNSSANFGSFLGRRATMFHGAAFFALKARVPLLVGMCRHGEDGKYKVDVHLVDTSDLTFCKEDIATLASRYSRVIEEYILKWPEEWFWLHNRWKNA